jgi:cytochrome P450
VLGSPEVLKQVLDQGYMTFDREKDLNDIFHDIASGASRSALRSVSSVVGSLRPQFGPYPIGLVLQFNGDGHRRSRKLVGPAFHKSNLNLVTNPNHPPCDDDGYDGG